MQITNTTPAINERKKVRFSGSPQIIRFNNTRPAIKHSNLEATQFTREKVLSRIVDEYVSMSKNFAQSINLSKFPEALQNFIKYIRNDKLETIKTNATMININHKIPQASVCNFLKFRKFTIYIINILLKSLNDINNNFLKTYNEISKMNIDKSKLSEPKQKEFNEILSKGDEIIELRETVIGFLDKKHPENNDLVGWAIKIQKINKAFKSQSEALEELKTVLLSFQ